MALPTDLQVLSCSSGNINLVSVESSTERNSLTADGGDFSHLQAPQPAHYSTVATKLTTAAAQRSSKTSSRPKIQCPVCASAFFASGLNRHITVRHPDYRRAHPLPVTRFHPYGGDTPNVAPAVAVCSLCQASVKNIALHNRIHHPQLATARLVSAVVPGAARGNPDIAEQRVASVVAELDVSYGSQFSYLTSAIAADDWRFTDSTLDRFNCEYERFVAALLALQPNFYKSRRRRRQKKRKSAEEVSYAQLQYKWKEAQYLFKEEPRKLRRKIYGEEPDDAVFSADGLFTHFSALYSVPNNSVASIEHMPEILNRTDVINNDVIAAEHMSQIRADEVLAAIKRMSFDTAAGLDKLRVKTLRTYDPHAKLMAAFFNICFRTGHVPKAWNVGRTVVLCKPNKDHRLLANRRPISITSVVRRIYCRVINRRLVSHTKLHYSQKGFQRGPGLLTNIHIARELLLHSRRTGRRLYMVFFDVKRAFDSVGHAQVFLALQRMGVPGSLIDAVKGLYRSFSTHIVHKNVASRAVNVACGVLQGCPCSPTLFNTTINFILEYLHERLIGLGYVVDEVTTVLAAMFADDLLICAQDSVGAQRLCQRCCRLAGGDWSGNKSL